MSACCPSSCTLRVHAGRIGDDGFPVIIVNLQQQRRQLDALLNKSHVTTKIYRGVRASLIIDGRASHLNSFTNSYRDG